MVPPRAPITASYAAADYRRFRSMNEPRNSDAVIRRLEGHVAGAG
jgi:hypothetical protein